MGQIDSILEDISVASEGAVADVQTIQTQINALSSTVTSLEATVQTAVEDVAAMETTVASHESRMDTIEQDLITQNNLIKTLSDAVTAMQTTVAQLNNRVQVIESTVSAQGVDLGALQTAMSTLQSSVSSLDSRVTALEQGGTTGGGMPAIDTLTQVYNNNFNRNSISGTSGRVTLYTATQDMYIKIRMWLYTEIPANFSPSGNTFSRSLSAVVGNTTLQSCGICAAFPYGTATQACYAENEVYTELVKVSQGTEIKVDMGSHFETNIDVNFEITGYTVS